MIKTKAEILAELPTMTEAEYDTQVKAFIIDLRSKIPMLQAATNRKAFNEVMALTQRIRSAAINLRLENIASLCSSILNNLRTIPDLPLLSELQRQLLVEMNNVDRDQIKAAQ
ncbi:MAG TPA: hypothetical protein PLU72_09730 [Candidatus Ozemobacteraceae bacterium]|nr:hypothetical protein [Candidatus Ozemobacteraceae bacterium]